MHHGHPRWNVAGRRAEVNQSTTFSRRVPRGNRIHAYFQLERSGNAIARLEAIVLWSLPVRVQIDKTGCHYQAANIHNCPALERRLSDRSDFSSTNPDVSYAIQVRFRIHYPPV